MSEIMWYEIKIKADELCEEAINSILYEMDASGILIENSEDVMFQEGYEGDWDYFGIDLENMEQGFFIKAYLEFQDASEVEFLESRIDYKCMSREITTLSGETDFTKVSRLYGDIEQWVAELNRRIVDLAQYGFDISKIEVEYSKVPDVDYVNKWKQEYRPFEVGEDIVICPTWLKDNLITDKKVIFIDPGNAFGSGTHESTELCIGMINEYYEFSDRESFYDVGCGSGILSFVAHKLGFKHVVGIDIDDDAIAVSRSNAEFNGIKSGVSFVKGNLLDQLSEPSDFIVANIIADVIINMSADLIKILKKDGIFIGSGIINEKLDELKSVLVARGFEILEIANKNEWNAIVCKKR